MATFSSIITDIKALDTFNEKTSFLTVIINALQSKNGKITKEDKKELADFAFEEIKALIDLIPTVHTYKEKDEIFGYEDILLGIVMMCHVSPAEIHPANINDINTLIEIVNKERFVENAIDNIFKNRQNDRVTVEQLFCAVVPLKDEFQRGQVYQGLLHYRDCINQLPQDSKKLFSDYICAEIKRYLDSSIDDDVANNLEFACDVAQYFMNDTVIPLLNDVIKLGKNHISYYAVSSLLSANQSVASSVIVSLANDIEYADLTYSLLKKYGLVSLFPPELSAPEYLAKSNMVHWLIYPTELGKLPDRIEYIGKVKKKEEYFIFRFSSDSDNLGEDLKGKWLIGWSSEEGGTFSNFDLYSDFEQNTVEKTLKKIKKKLL